MYKGYIYRHWIVNNEGVEKSYIGQVYNRTPEQRWGKDGNGYKPKKGDEPTHFYNAIQVYSWDNFQHKVLLTVECETLEELVFWLDQWETFYIEKYDSFKHGYNSTTGGNRGKIVDEETKQKQSKAKKGKYCGKDNPFYGKGFHGEDHPFYGKHHTEESKQKISSSKKGQCIGKNNGNASCVICLETLQVFETVKDASIWIGHKSHGNICSCCIGKKKSCGKHPETGEKLHWMYYKDYLKQKEVTQ